MQHEMAQRARKFNWILKKDVKGYLHFNRICGTISDITDSNVYILNDKGNILGGYYRALPQAAYPFVAEIDSGMVHDKYMYNSQKDFQLEIQKENSKIREAYRLDVKTKNNQYTKIPIIGTSRRIGTLVVSRCPSALNDEDLAFVEFGATIAGLEIQATFNRNVEEVQRKEKNANQAVRALTYSECEAVKRILKRLKHFEGRLTVSKIADDSNIARAVYVNGIRKLESAGIIESKSLGPRGTYIRVLDKTIFKSLNNRGDEPITNRG